MKKIGDTTPEHDDERPDEHSDEPNDKARQILRNVTDILIVLLLPGPLLIVLFDSVIKDKPYFESVRSFHGTYLTDLFIAAGIIVVLFVAFDIYRKFGAKG